MVAYQVVVAHGAAGGGVTWEWYAWAWLFVPLAVYFLIVALLLSSGERNDPRVLGWFFGSISDSLRRVTGFPGWSMAGALTALMALVIAVTGFYWDVAWHIDHGRDVALFTPPHVMILVGLGGLVAAAALAVIFASLDRADVGVRAGPVRVPWSAMLLAAVGAGGVAGFPLDELWHRAYGLDVTLWSPTHLQLVTGGSLGTLGALLMCAEALPSARLTRLGRLILVVTTGTVLVGASTVQGEFDFGVPQFQLLYWPVLVSAAAGFSLVLGRLVLGPWGAVKVAVVALVLRALLALAVGVGLEHSVPRFPLFVPTALLVEAAVALLRTDRRLHVGLAAGAVVGTLGLATELAWVRLSGWWPELAEALLAETAVLGLAAAVAAGLLAAGLARAFRPHDERVPLGVLALSGLVLVATLAYPLPRNVGDVDAVIALDDIGETAVVEVELTPSDAPRNADAFVVMSWQGGGRAATPLDEVAPGRYRTPEPVPVSGEWKSMVALYRGDETMAAPVYLPADPDIGASAVPAVPEREVSFVRNTKVLLREAHDGPAWPSVLAYSALGGLVALWVALMAVTARRAAAGWRRQDQSRPPTATSQTDARAVTSAT